MQPLITDFILGLMGQVPPLQAFPGTSPFQPSGSRGEMKGHGSPGAPFCHPALSRQDHDSPSFPSNFWGQILFPFSTVPSMAPTRAEPPSNPWVKTYLGILTKLHITIPSVPCLGTENQMNPCRGLICHTTKPEEASGQGRS